MNIGKFLPPVMVAATLLSACGGGSSTTTSGTDNTTITTGGSSTTLANASTAYSGSRTLALLNASNSPDFVDTLFGTENINNNITARPQDAAPTGNSSLLQPQRILSALGNQHVRHQLYQARSVDLTDNCPDGGTANAKGELSDSTNTGTLQITYSQCRSENVETNGSALLVIHSFNMAALEPDAYTVSMQGLGVKVDNTPYTVTGTLRTDTDTATGQSTLTINQYQRNLTTGQQALAEDFIMSVESTGYTDMQGKLCEGSHGCVDTDTINPFLFNTAGEAQEGELIMSGASGSKIRVVVSGGMTEIQLDTNGDNVYDATASNESSTLRELLANNGDDGLVFDDIPNTPPQAVFTLPTTITAGSSVVLNARSSSDAEGDALTYLWTLEAAPEGSLASIDNPTSVVANFQPDKQGTYDFSLKVTDAQQNETLTTASITVMGSVDALLHKVVDAEYSNALNRLITVSNEPASALHIIHPQTGSQQTVALHFAPTSVAISPDGKTAVVGHDGAVTHVDLLDASMIDFHTGLGFRVFDIVLDANGMAYATPPAAMQWNYLYAINLASGEVSEDTATDDTRLFGGAHLQLLPALDAVYTLDSSISPVDLSRYDVSAAQPVRGYDSPYHGHFDMGANQSNLWASEDGMYLLTAGGTLFQTANQQEADMKYQRTLSDDDGLGGSYLIQADHSQKAAKFVAIEKLDSGDSAPVYNLKTYTMPLLNLDNSMSLNGLTIDGSSAAVTPQFVFFNESGSQRYVVLEQGGSAYLMTF